MLVIKLNSKSDRLVDTNISIIILSRVMNQRNVSRYKNVFFFDCSTLVRNLINILSRIPYLGASNLSSFRSCRKTETTLIFLSDHGSLFSNTKLAFL